MCNLEFSAHAKGRSLTGAEDAEGDIPDDDVASHVLDTQSSFEKIYADKLWGGQQWGAACSYLQELSLLVRSMCCMPDIVHIQGVARGLEAQYKRRDGPGG